MWRCIFQQLLWVGGALTRYIYYYTFYVTRYLNFWFSIRKCFSLPFLSFHGYMSIYQKHPHKTMVSGNASSVKHVFTCFDYLPWFSCKLVFIYLGSNLFLKFLVTGSGSVEHYIFWSFLVNKFFSSFLIKE
jgi:hypothetical protein